MIVLFGLMGLCIGSLLNILIDRQVTAADRPVSSHTDFLARPADGHAQPRIDDGVENINGEIDDHENQAD